MVAPVRRTQVDLALGQTREIPPAVCRHSQLPPDLRRRTRSALHRPGYLCETGHQALIRHLPCPHPARIPGCLRRVVNHFPRKFTRQPPGFLPSHTNRGKIHNNRTTPRTCMPVLLQGSVPVAAFSSVTARSAFQYRSATADAARRRPHTCCSPSPTSPSASFPPHPPVPPRRSRSNPQP